MTHAAQSRAARTIARCRDLARISDVAGETTRLFLSPATVGAHAQLTSWMMQAGLEVRTDDAGNLRGVRAGGTPDAPALLLFSHIDTVPNAGAFDGVLGVLLALTVIEELGKVALPFAMELIAFSEEEGVRFGFPFLSSLAVTGQLTEQHLGRRDEEGTSVAEAIRGFGLDPGRMKATCPLDMRTIAAVEVHIEQGPVLESDGVPLAAVTGIIGQSRLRLTFVGQANHAGTTPMALRQDALVAAAHWIVEVERYAASFRQLVATVGKVDVLPGAGNVVPGTVHATLDVRHPDDNSRHSAVARLVTKAEHAAASQGVTVHAQHVSEQAFVPLDVGLAAQLAAAAERAGYPAKFLYSGAGHDAMILAQHVPTAMMFVRSPGGLSHHPEEDVLEEDVEAAIATMLEFVTQLTVR